LELSKVTVTATLAMVTMRQSGSRRGRPLIRSHLRALQQMRKIGARPLSMEENPALDSELYHLPIAISALGPRRRPKWRGQSG
jgi:hypothetical protein